MLFTLVSFSFFISHLTFSWSFSVSHSPSQGCVPWLGLMFTAFTFFLFHSYVCLTLTLRIMCLFTFTSLSFSFWFLIFCSCIFSLSTVFNNVSLFPFSFYRRTHTDIFKEARGKPKENIGKPLKTNEK